MPLTNWPHSIVPMKLAPIIENPLPEPKPPPDGGGVGGLPNVPLPLPETPGPIGTPEPLGIPPPLPGETQVAIAAPKALTHAMSTFM